jgi:hypothetical protein
MLNAGRLPRSERIRALAALTHSSESEVLDAVVATAHARAGESVLGAADATRPATEVRGWERELRNWDQNLRDRLDELDGLAVRRILTAAERKESAELRRRLGP